MAMLRYLPLIFLGTFIYLWGCSTAFSAFPPHPCTSDYQCPEAQFCYQEYGRSYCLPCRYCKDYNRESVTRKCVTSRLNCGPCLSDLFEIATRCRRQTAHVLNVIFKTNRSTRELKEDSPRYSSIAATIALCTILVVVPAVVVMYVQGNPCAAWTLANWEGDLIDAEDPQHNFIFNGGVAPVNPEVDENPLDFIQQELQPPNVQAEAMVAPDNEQDNGNAGHLSASVNLASIPVQPDVAQFLEEEPGPQEELELELEEEPVDLDSLYDEGDDSDNNNQWNPGDEEMQDDSGYGDDQKIAPGAAEPGPSYETGWS